MFQRFSRVLAHSTLTLAVAVAATVTAGVVLPHAAFAQSEQISQATLSGSCSDSEGIGLGGVQCKVFVNGFMKGQAISGGDGSYSTTFEYDPLADVSIVAWWIPQAGYVPEIVVLRESKMAAAMGIWSPCLPRVDVGSSVPYSVSIKTEDEKFAELGASDCIQ